mgnify:CR=1 FL=1
MDINLTLVGQGITFFLFILFTMKFVWPPLSAAMEERQAKIAEGLNRAERGQQELAQAQEKAAEIVREARTQASEIIEQANKRGGEIVEEAKQAAKASGLLPRLIRRSSRSAPRCAPSCSSRSRHWPSPALLRSSSARWTPRPTMPCSKSWPANFKGRFRWRNTAPSRGLMPKAYSS